ncbi:MAG: UDP-N-acetylglucosamine 1-carboxyvinyltransferase [Oligoflexia bacterium]|nr:UDP-N-acetylglucosamine 1-carboxyvinyltransferase [Oligoflexia bacterium]
MDKLIISGPAKLRGEVTISASKNASLPILTATLLSTTPVTFKSLPKLRDVSTLFKLLKNLGATINSDDQNELTTINTTPISSLEATYDLVKTMRASFLVMGPLLARYGKAKVSLPGGCAIGARAIDIHLEALTKMGAKINLQGGYVEATLEHGPKRLQGNEIYLSFPSVGATENLMMAATLAHGTTVIKNAAQEPEIADLGEFLNRMGAKVQGAGSAEVIIEGQESLLFSGSPYVVIPDRIESATYLIAGVMTNSEITIHNINAKHLDAVIATLKDMGAKLEIDYDKKIIKTLLHQGLHGTHVATAPYPGFPTDVQAQLMALTTIAQTPSVITEHIFENRFMHVPELNRMGANIVLKGNSAFIDGQSTLKSAPVMCTDLRASAALVLAALAAEGQSEVCRIYHLDRGYEKIDQKLQTLNVDITRVPGDN